MLKILLLLCGLVFALCKANPIDRMFPLEDFDFRDKVRFFKKKKEDHFLNLIRYHFIAPFEWRRSAGFRTSASSDLRTEVGMSGRPQNGLQGPLSSGLVICELQVNKTRFWIKFYLAILHICHFVVLSQVLLSFKHWLPPSLCTR